MWFGVVGDLFYQIGEFLRVMIDGVIVQSVIDIEGVEGVVIVDLVIDKFIGGDMIVGIDEVEYIIVVQFCYVLKMGYFMQVIGWVFFGYGGVEFCFWVSVIVFCWQQMKMVCWVFQ